MSWLKVFEETRTIQTIRAGYPQMCAAEVNALAAYILNVEDGIIVSFQMCGE